MRWLVDLGRLGSDTPFTRRMLSMALTSFLLLIVAGAAAIYMANRAAEAEGRIVHTMDVRREARALLVDLLNAETGTRGFVLTQNEGFLAPFNQAEAKLRRPVDALSSLTSDNPSQQLVIRGLSTRVDARMEELRRMVALVRQGRSPDAVAMVKSAAGKELMDDIREDIDRIFSEETRLLSLRQDRASALRAWVLALIGTCLIAAMGLAVLTLRTMVHYVERIEAEAKLRRRTEETLRQAQKLEAVGQLTGGIAHDFNNLLTIIIGNLDTMKRRLAKDAGDLGAALGRLVDNALEGARNAAQLTHRLLAFSRRQPLEPKRVDLNRVVSGMSELLRRTLGEPVDVETVLAGGLWPTFADAHQLENVLINLGTNARDAMPDGGRITIETANAYLDDAYVARFSEVPAGQYVLLSVADTGTGIPPKVLEHVFEPFFTTKEVGRGTGLGLAMVHGFVKQSGGHIRIYSEEGHGTTVKIYLPRLRETEEIASVPAAADEAAVGGEVGARNGEAILLVEDNDGVRAYTKSTLEELGYQVLEAADASQALRHLGQAARIDLLFTDVVLPGGMGGRELAQRVARERPSLPVLFTTGYTRNAIIHQRPARPGRQPAQQAVFAAGPGAQDPPTPEPGRLRPLEQEAIGPLLSLLDEMLDRHAAAVHLVLEALHGRTAEVPGEARMRGAAAHDLVGQERIKIVHRIGLGGRGGGPILPEKLEAPLHLGEHEDRFLAHGVGAGLAPAHRALAVERAALTRFAAACHHEGRRLVLACHGEREGMEARLGGRADLGADVAARDRIGLAGGVVDAPGGERLAVGLVEVAEAGVGELPGRPQLAGAESGQRPASRLDDRRGALEAFDQRHGGAEGDALDAEARFRRRAAGILEHARDEAIAARGEYLGRHALASLS
jgi:signal transduction histidine kinase